MGIFTVKHMTNVLSGGVATEGGNGGGANCVFPFKYKNVAYTACTKTDDTKLWCATTSSYDVDGRWGYCISKYKYGISKHGILATIQTI